MTQNKSIITSIKWSFVESLFSRGFSLLVWLFLARLLLPESFGLIGMAAVFISFLNIFAEMGMAAALIQRDEATLRKEHWDTAFTFSVVAAVLGWVFIYTTSPLVALFYKEPALRLVFPVLGLSLVCDTLSITQRAKLQREIKFKSLSIISILTTLISSIVAIGMAFKGFGVWALIAKTLLGSGLKTTAMWIISPYRYAFKINKNAFIDLFGFSAYVAISNIVFFFTNNLDYLLIGKLLGSSILGIYTLAFTLTDAIRKQVMGTFNKVFFPVFSKMQNDKKTLALYYLKIVKYNMLIITPMMLFLILEARPIIINFFGVEWELAITPLRLLALGSIIHTLGGASATLIRGVGRARLVMYIDMFKVLIVTAPAITFGAHLWGCNGVAWAVVVHKTVGRILYYIYIRKIFHITLLDLWSAISPCILPLLAMVCVHFLIRHTLPPNTGTEIVRELMEIISFLFFTIVALPELRQLIKRQLFETQVAI